MAIPVTCSIVSTSRLAPPVSNASQSGLTPWPGTSTLTLPGIVTTPPAAPSASMCRSMTRLLRLGDDALAAPVIRKVCDPAARWLTLMRGMLPTSLLTYRRVPTTAAITRTRNDPAEISTMRLRRRLRRGGSVLSAVPASEPERVPTFMSDVSDISLSPYPAPRHCPADLFLPVACSSYDSIQVGCSLISDPPSLAVASICYIYITQGNKPEACEQMAMIPTFPTIARRGNCVSQEALTERDRAQLVRSL